MGMIIESSAFSDSVGDHGSGGVDSILPDVSLEGLSPSVCLTSGLPTLIFTAQNPLTSQCGNPSLE